jgi:hypothetical protein
MAKAQRRKAVRRATVSPNPERRNLEIEYVDPKTLDPWEGNPRKNDKAVKRLVPLIEEHGFVNPIICTPRGKVLAGHTRMKAALAMKAKRVPVIRVPFGSDEKAEAYAIAENRSHEFAEWNEEILGDWLSKHEKVQAEHLGFEQVEVEGLKQATLLPPGMTKEDLLAVPLEDTDIEGEDDSTNRFIIIYKSEEEKEAICTALGMDGHKIVWTMKELAVSSTHRPRARRAK